MKLFRFILLLQLFIFVGCSLFSGNSLEIFGYWSDNMVIQRNKSLDIDGIDIPKQKIVLKFNGYTLETITDEYGKWKLSLPSMSANNENQVLSIKGSSSLTFYDVLIGDVWLASGQSNMELTMVDTIGWNEQRGNPKNLRLLQVNRSIADNPVGLTGLADSSWTKTGYYDVSRFSAVAYYYAKKVKENIDIPIGIINSSYGSTLIKSWCEKDNLISEAGFNNSDFSSSDNIYDPSKCFNAMISPLKALNICGVIWYQGEGDVNNEEQDYKLMLDVLLSSFKENFNVDSLPFYLVQIPYYTSYNSSALIGRLNTAQYNFAKDHENVGIIAINDTINDYSNIHPDIKKPVGDKLADMVLTGLYKNEMLNLQTNDCEGPNINTAYSSGSTIIIEYGHFGSGLTTWDKKPLYGYEIAGNDNIFYNAQVSINGNIVKLQSSYVSEPKYIRTGYNNSSDHLFNLSNIEGYSALSFLLELE